MGSTTKQHGDSTMKHRVGDELRRFWVEDHGLSLLLVLLVAVVFVLPVFGHHGPLGSLAGELVFSALLVTGALTLPERRWLRWAVPPFAAIAVLIRWAGMASASVDLVAWRDLSTLVTLILFAAVVAGQVYRSGPVTFHRILGAVAVYLLLGLTWASAYAFVDHLHPDAFAGTLGDTFIPETWIYYSFVTLTTMGYGDITPVHPAARSLAIAEAVTGQLYIAITLARMVSLYVGTRGQR
jgi:4-amino-4-deoxy-L-arabinose transferase-like glycosyltransferase